MTTWALVFATALAGYPGAPAGHTEQACRGSLQGDVLETTIQFRDGSRLIGPWRVTDKAERAAAHQVTATLDRVIEVDRRGTPKETRFPHGVAVKFEGDSERALVHRAAQVWCSTVLRAKRAVDGPRDWLPPGTRITAVDGSGVRVG